MTELGKKILEDGLYKSGYMPHDVIDLMHTGKITEDECNLILYGTTKPPTLKQILDAAKESNNA